MNEHEHLIARLRGLASQPVDPDVAGQHIAAIGATVGSEARSSWALRRRVVAAFAVGLLAGTLGLATAGALPNGAQDVAHKTLGAVGLSVPHGDRYQGPECGGEVKNHGQYVRSQPKGKRAEAAASRCGKPVQAGNGDDPAGGPGGQGAECHGPPPWAGKGKPDAAAKAARKQACGQGQDDEGDDKDDQKATPAPAAGVQPAAPQTPETSSTTGSPGPAPDTTVTTTTGPADTTVTTGSTDGPATTTSTAGSAGTPAPSPPVEPPAVGPS